MLIFIAFVVGFSLGAFLIAACAVAKAADEREEAGEGEPRMIDARAIVRADEARKWAIETFGLIAVDRRERACRFLEEAIELAQAEGLPPRVLSDIIDRVYSRPAGDAAKEIGQSMMTLSVLAWNIGLIAETEGEKEFERVKSIPKDEWTRRHEAKVKIGIASL